MIQVTLVGTGTVSKHLLKVFSEADEVRVNQVIPSRGDAFKKALQAPPRQDEGQRKTEQPNIYIIAVSDDAITTVSQELIKLESLVVHTSGSVSMSALPEGVRRGIFYPLQTFSKGKKVDFKTIPICIEAENKEDLELLQKLGDSISDSVYEITSEQRKSLHLGAVLVNNFTNHLYHIANQVCLENQVPFAILKPLIRETVNKLDSLPPIDAQSGPAKRNDQETIEKHLNQLKNMTHRDVYQILTKSIKETYGEKL